MKIRLWMPALLLAFTPLTARADVRPNTLCTEGMVLQQKSNVKIWGEADKGEKVTVSFRGKTVAAEADTNGNWVATVPSGDAGGPFELTIAGNNKIDYKNILVGEVWVCSGQSNMEWTVNASNDADKQSAKSEPHNPMLRMFTVKHVTSTTPKTNAPGSWVEAKPETVGGFSAVGYFFGRDLNKSQKVPVGLIHTSWGGTRAEAWTSKEVLNGHEWFKDEHPNFAKALEKYAESVKDAPEPKKLKNPENANSPSVLYNAMIVPILNYGIKGAIWYQGESNAGQAYKYRTLFPMMIQNWRKDFAQGDFPFYFVQLASYMALSPTPGDSNWAELREAQALTLKLNHTGMAVITDLGNVQDIHPTPKRPVGERLALIARANDYGEKIVYSGPMYKKMKIDGDKANVSFDHFGGGLVAKTLAATTVVGPNKKETTAYRVDPNAQSGELTGFAICGKDQKFYNAKAVIQGSDVIVSSPDVPEPIAVRYGWANYPICGLFNTDGLPASPFRTDDFRITTQPK